MYAKVLLPSDPPMAMLVWAVDPLIPLVSQLRESGWVQDTDEVQPDASLHITPASLVLTVDGNEILSDATNPVAPEGWWNAIGARNDHAVVVLVSNKTDVGGDDLATDLLAATDDENTAWGVVKVTH